MMVVMLSVIDNGEDALHQVEEIDARKKHQEFVDVVQVVLCVVVIVSVFVNVEA